MNGPQHPQWFTEASEATGTAFSLQTQRHIHSEITPFQKIDIYDTTTFGRLMTIDDLTMVTDRDNFIYHEMMVHPALCSHANPQTVAIIGGGDCGTLKEVLKHSTVQKATQIEIDERVTRLAEEYFPELCSANQDSRATLLFDDGIQWVKDQTNDSLDILIIDSTDPIGPAEGLFSAPFYQQANRILKQDGLLIQQSESPLIHQSLIGDIHTAMRASGFKHTALLTFPLCSYPSGWWSATLAGNQPISTQPQENKDHAHDLHTKYYNKQIHSAAFALPDFIKKTVNPT